ncbi:MAG: fibronectin type III domain-containing protein [Bacteroidales bacterium]|nr:fibronectin type III domain-containing protein [Bacteroidales bacterium]
MKKLSTLLIAMLLCGAAQAQIDSLQQIPATVPYTCDFSNQGENAHWIFSRYPAPASTLFYNHFVIGTGTSVTGLPADYSLYVSRDTSGSYISMGENCHLFAERLIDFGAGGTFDLEFDWKASGCTPNAYQSAGMKVFLRDTSDLMPAGAPSYANEHLDYALYDNAWRHGHVNLGYASGVKTLQFYTWGYSASQASQVPAAVDNVSVYASDCWPPSFTLSLDTSAVTFYWQGSPADTFLIVYRPESGTYPDNVYDTVTGSSYAVTGLMPNTPYVAWMARICDGHASALSEAFHFVTPCMTYPTPFVETFATDANCWSWDNNFFTYQSGYIYTTSYNSFSPILAVSPVIDASGLAHPYLRFSHYQPDFQGYHKDVAVYYRDNAQDSWHKLGTYVTPTTTWVTDSLSLPSNSSTLQLAFEGVGSAYNTRAQFDNISVYDGPACPVVSEVVSAGTDNNGDVVVTWIGAPSYSYVVRCKKASDTAWTNYGVVVTEEVTLPSLESLTSYIVEVATLCDTTEAYYIQGTFTTGMAPVDLPYSTDFADTSDQSWVLDNGNCGNHWTMGAPGVGTLNNALFIAQNYATTAGYNVSATTNVCAYKTFHTSGGPTVYLEFDVQAGGESTNDYLKVFWAPDSVEFPASTGSPDYSQIYYTTNALSFIDYVGQTGSPNYPYKLNLTNGNVIHVSMELANITPNGVAKLVFAWHNNYSSGTQPGAIVSNVHVWQPACEAVYDLMVAGTFMDTAMVTWTSYEPSATYMLQYKPQTLAWTDPGVVSMTVTDTFAMLTGLQEHTLYDVRVATNCSSDTAEWRNISFISGCAIEVVTDAQPFLETFPAAPECWALNTNPWHSWTWTNGKLYHNHIYPGTDTCGITSSVFDISAVTRPYVSVKHSSNNGSNNADDFGVYYRTSAMGGWHRRALFTQSASALQNDSIPLPSGSDYIQLAFFAKEAGGGTITVDDISVFNGPECPPIYYLTADGITTDSATISWVGFSDNGYAIRYRILPDTTWVYYDTTYDQFYIFDGLQGSKNYQVQVSSVCSGSAWKSVSFSTPLGIEDLPYYTDFSPSYDQDWGLNNGSCNNRWMVGQVDTTADADYGLFISNNGVTPNYGNGQSTVTAEKIFRIGTNPEISIEFDVKVGGESRYDFMKLLLSNPTVEYAASTAMSNSASYPLYIMYNINWSGYSFDFTNYKPLTGNQQYPYIFNMTNGNVVHITAIMANPYYNPDANSAIKVAFAWTNDNAVFNQPGAIIYNVSVHSNNCDPVNNLAITEMHPTSATFAWAPGNVETAWNVDYKEASATSWTSNAVNSPSFTLTSLQPETEYFVRVQADCGNGDVSNYEMLSFYTPSCEVADQCEYTLILTDTYGDGWSGGHLYVRQNGVQIADLAAVDHVGQHGTMSYDTIPLMLCHGANVQLVWDNGNMFNQCGFIFQSPEGTTLYQIDELFNHYPDTTLYAFTADCPVVPPVVVTDSVSQIGQTNATFHGHIVDLGNQPIINQGFEWKILSSGSYSHSVNVAENPMVYIVTDLQHSTQYVMRAFVATDTAVYYGSEITFATEQGPCPAPTNLHVTDSTENTLSIEWTETGDAEQWNIQYRAGSGEMSSDVSYATSYLITDLQPNTEYQIQVQSVCGVQTSDWTPVVLGKTTHVDSTGIVDYNSYVRVYPNPAGDFINVQCTMNNVQGDGMSVEVVDVYGKVVRAVVGANNHSPLQTRINVSDLAAGMYFVRVATEEGVVTKAFVKK